MIDEAWLKINELGYLLRMGGLPETQDEDDESEEVENFVRLGLWAKQWGKPVLDDVLLPPYADSDLASLLETLRSRAKTALSQLPKGSGE